MYRCVGCISLTFAFCAAALLTHCQKTAWTEATQCELDALSHLSSFSFSSSLLPSHLAGTLIKEAEHIGGGKRAELHTAPDYLYTEKYETQLKVVMFLCKKKKIQQK